MHFCVNCSCRTLAGRGSPGANHCLVDCLGSGCQIQNQDSSPVMMWTGAPRRQMRCKHCCADVTLQIRWAFVRRWGIHLALFFFMLRCLRRALWAVPLETPVAADTLLVVTLLSCCTTPWIWASFAGVSFLGVKFLGRSFMETFGSASILAIHRLIWDLERVWAPCARLKCLWIFPLFMPRQTQKRISERWSSFVWVMLPHAHSKSALEGRQFESIKCSEHAIHIQWALVVSSTWCNLLLLPPKQKQTKSVWSIQRNWTRRILDCTNLVQNTCRIFESNARISSSWKHWTDFASKLE